MSASRAVYKKKNSQFLLVSIIGAFLFLGAIGYFFYSTPYSIGDQIRPYTSADMTTDHMRSVRADVTDMSTYFSELITILTSTFGFIAFLVTYQAKLGLPLTRRAWSLLLIGIMALVNALILCLFGKEILIRMTIVNSIELDLAALRFGRMANYVCLIIAAICIGFFAVEIASNAKPAITPNNSEHEMD